MPPGVLKRSYLFAAFCAAGVLARGRFAAQRLRLRLERVADAFTGAGPRIVATACWSFPIYSQTFVYEELRQLVRQGYGLRFVYSRLDRRHARGFRFPEVWRARRRLELHPFVCTDSERWFRRHTPDRVDALLARLAAAAGMAVDDVRAHPHVRQGFAFARLVAACRPDYLHSYFFYEGSLYALMAASLLEVPRGVSCYADHVLDDYPFKLVPLHLTECRLVLATSLRVRAELRSIGPASGQVLVKPNGIDVTHFPARERPAPGDGQPVRLLSVSRLDPKKGLVHLVEAVALLHGQGRPVTLQIVGDADESEASRRCAIELRQRVSALGLAGVVRFEGRRTPAEVEAFFARAHVFVAPFVETPAGDKDGVPTALLEAMASGLAVVVTDAGSITEVVTDGHEGIVVPQRSPTALADAIAALCDDPERCARLGRNASARVRRQFDTSVSERVFHETLLRLLTRPGEAAVPPQPNPDPA